MPQPEDSQRIPIYFDCDPGIDDSLALGYLVGAPKSNLVGIGTVCGNIGAVQGARNACDWLNVMGKPDIPVAIGAENPSWGEFYGGALWIHGDKGTGAIELPKSPVDPVEMSAVDLLLSLADQYEGELVIVAVGPLTNIADALAARPELPKQVKKLTLMGGTAFHPGNISPVTEANIGNDPESSRKVFEADWEIEMVGLDVTLTNRLTEAHRTKMLESGSRSAVLLAEEVDFYFNFHVDIFGERASALHDPLAAAIALGDIEVVTAPVVNVEVDDTQGPGRGQTICDLRGLYNDYPEQEGAHTRVYLDVGTTFADKLVKVLISLP